MTWGIGAWGHTPWGVGGLDALLNIVSLYADTDRSLHVVLSMPPMQSSEIGTGDALNPLTWIVVNDGAALTVINVEQLDTVTFVVRTLQTFDSWLHDVTLSTSTLLDAGGASTLPLAASVPGANAVLSTSTAPDFVDVANPQFVNGQPGGQMLVAAGGDLENESGGALLRKLVIRFLVTQPGSLFGQQDYGVGLRTQEPLATSDLVALRQQIERGLLKFIPHAVGVGCRLTLSANVLTVQVQVRLETGSSVGVDVQVPTSGSVQL
jgi:hypothetical protein